MHTKGKWSLRESPSGGAILVRGEKAGSHPQHMLQIVPIEDARLIAAAPELLEACKALEAADHQWANCPECSEATSFPELCETCFPLFDDARLKRRAAIAKAEAR